MDELVDYTKRLAPEHNLHAREIQWLSQLVEHVRVTINLDLLDPPTTINQICKKIIEILYKDRTTANNVDVNSKNFVLPVDALPISISELKAHSTAYRANLDNLWHENFYSYLSPSADHRPASAEQSFASLDQDRDAIDSSQCQVYDNVMHSSQLSGPRIKQLPSKPYLLLGHFAITRGPAGLPLLSLRDSTGEVPIEWTGRPTEALLTVAVVADWNYIPHYSHLEPGYVELSSLETCRPVWPLRVSQHLWSDTLTADWHQYGAISIEEFIASNDKIVHLVGTVTAMSPLIRQSATHAFYFVELSSVAEPLSPLATLSTVVLIAGSLTFMRRLMRIGHIYYVTNLQLATLFPKTENERRIFTTSPKSSAHVIESAARLTELWLTRERLNTRKRKSSTSLDHEQHAKRHCADVRMSDAAVVAPLSTPPSTRARISYSGELTRYCGNCVYELDGALKLYVTQHDFEDTHGRGLRVGATITAHNVHPIHLQGQLHGFGCCVYSTVEVTAFSATLTTFRPLLQTTNLYKPYWDALTFREFVLLHSFYESWRTAFTEVDKADLLGTEDIRAPGPHHAILATLLHALHVPLRRDSIYDQFFAHSTHCNNDVESDDSDARFHWLALNDIVKRAERSATDLAAYDNWACTTLSSSDFNGQLIGKCTLVDQHGVVCLHLLQGSVAIPLIIDGDSMLGATFIDTIVLVRNYQLIVENLTRVINENETRSHMTWIYTNSQYITILHCTPRLDTDLAPAMLESCGWPQRHDGSVTSQCVLTPLTEHATPCTKLLRGPVAGLSRYMCPGTALTACLSRAEMHCSDLALLSCPLDHHTPSTVRHVLTIEEPDNCAALVPALAGLVTHLQLLEDDNSPAVYRLDYRPQRKICEGKLVVKLQDERGPDSVDVYLKLGALTYPVGLVPGTRVIMYNIERKVSKTHTIYCALTENSWLVMRGWDTLRLRDTSNRSGPLDSFDVTRCFQQTTPLIEFQNPNRILRYYLRVSASIDKIISLKAEWLCSGCDRLSVNEICVHGCKNQGFYFNCVLVAAIEDGTNQVDAVFKGDLVWQILDMAEQTSAIMEQVMHIGPIKYSHGRFFCSDRPISAHQTKEIQSIDDQINNDEIYRSWILYGRQFYKTEVSDEQWTALRKAPFGLDRAQTSAFDALAHCHYDVRCAVPVVAATSAQDLLDLLQRD